MANTFTNLPAPAANGVGAAVDLSSDGASKTFIVDGTWGLPPTVQIEMNDDAAQAGSWVPVTRSFQGRGEQTVDVVGRWFRVRVSNYRGGGAPAVNCGSNDNGTTLLNLPVPATTNGAGAAQASSTAGPFKTFCVQGPFRGVVNIEVSTDGATEWSVAASFQQPGYKNLVLTSSFVRAVRVGVPPQAPGTPIVTMASEDPPAAGGSNIALSASATSQSNGTIVFSNANNITFGMTGSTITASASGGAGGVAVSASASSVSNGTVVFSNSNNVTFGLNGSTVTASAAGGLALSAGTASVNAGTVVFSNSNNLSFGLNGSTVTGSFSQSVQPAVQRLSAGTTFASGTQIVFSNSNGVSFGADGNTITAAIDAISSISAGTTNATGPQVVFSNANGMSFGVNGNTVTGSFDGIRRLSAGTTLASASQVVFSNGNGVSFGVDGATITASVAAGAGGVALSAGTVSQSQGTIVFSNSNGVSFGLNVSTLTAAIGAVRSIAFGGGGTVSDSLTFSNQSGVSFITNATNGRIVNAFVAQSARQIQDPAQFAFSAGMSNAALSLYRMANPFYATVTQARYAMQFAMTTDGASTEQMVLQIGVYTMSGSTASLASSASLSLSINGGVVVNSTAPGLFAYSGFTFNMTPGDYLFAHHFRTTASFISSISMLGMNSVSFTALNNAFSASNTAQFVNGYSNSSFTTAMPGSIHITNTNYVRTGSSANRHPSFILLGA